MIIGIVGAEGAKFTSEAERGARGHIQFLLLERPSLVVSGACHLGGIDRWAVEEAEKLGIPTKEFPPAKQTWEGGYKQRNIQIAEASDIVHNIVVDKLPANFTGPAWLYCYHCHTRDHVKSGGCWTAKHAQKLGKRAFWHVIVNEST